MNNEFINQITVDEVASLGKPNMTLTTKPYTAIYTCLIASIIMIISKSLAILGIFMLILAVFSLWKIPNEKRVEFFEKCFVIYIHGRNDICQKVEFSEVLEWRIKQGKTSADEFLLRLEGDKYITTPCFNSNKLFKKLNSIMPEKEANYIQKQKVQNTPIKWPWSK